MTGRNGLLRTHETVIEGGTPQCRENGKLLTAAARRLKFVHTGRLSNQLALIRENLPAGDVAAFNGEKPHGVGIGYGLFVRQRVVAKKSSNHEAEKGSARVAHVSRLLPFSLVSFKPTVPP